MAELVLVLGGARSGKSAVAERLVAAAGEVTYVATVDTGGDAELAERVAAHRARRPRSWRTVEGADPAAAVGQAPPGAAVLVDGIGAWLAGRMTALGLFEDDAPDPAGSRRRLLAEAAALVEAARAHHGGPVIVVAEEAGMGVVPAVASTRRWVDLHGEVVQALSAAADRALLVAAGRTLDLPRDPPGGAPAPGTGRPATAHEPGPGGQATRTGPATGEPRPVEEPSDEPAVTRTGPAAGAPRLLGEPAGEPAAAAWTGLRAHGDRMVPEGAVDMVVNVYGAGPPAHLLAALRASVEAAGAYPDPGPATAALAARHGRAEAEVLPTAGAAEAFWLLAEVVRAHMAVVVHPQFTEPEAALRAHGVAVERVVRRAADGWALDPGAVPREADLVVVGNPGNPTGTLDDPELVATLCRPGRVTVVDEAFIDFVADPAASLASRTDLPGLVVVRSVTKLWGLAGLRAGYLLGPAGLVARCAALRQPWAVGTPALAALAACAGDEPWRLEVAARVAAERERLLRALRTVPGVTAWEAAANFVLVRVPDGPAVHAALLARGIAVRPSTFPGLSPDHLRVTVRDEGATRALAAALDEILSRPRARAEQR